MVFEFVLYTVAIVSTLAIVGSSRKARKIAPVEAAIEPQELTESPLDYSIEVPDLFLPTYAELFAEADAIVARYEIETVLVEKKATLEEPPKVEIETTALSVPEAAAVDVPQIQDGFDSMGRDALRSACKAANIRWSKAGPTGKHLTCDEMRQALRAALVAV